MATAMLMAVIVETGRPPGEGNGNPLQYSHLENPMDGGDQQATVHVVTQSQTRLSDFTFTLYPSLHLSPRYPIWRVCIVTYYHFTKGETETPHGHMAYLRLQNRTCIEIYVFAIVYAYNSDNNVLHKNDQKIHRAITMTVLS